MEQIKKGDVLMLISKKPLKADEPDNYFDLDKGDLQLGELYIAQEDGYNYDHNSVIAQEGVQVEGAQYIHASENFFIIGQL